VRTLTATLTGHPPHPDRLSALALCLLLLPSMTPRVVLLVLSVLCAFAITNAQLDLGCFCAPDDQPVCVNSEFYGLVTYENPCTAECDGFGPADYTEGACAGMLA
jgi:hypothetical protein